MVLAVLLGTPFARPLLDDIALDITKEIPVTVGAVRVVAVGVVINPSVAGIIDPAVAVVELPDAIKSEACASAATFD